MTTIAGVAEGGKVYMAGDRLVCMGETVVYSDTPKIKDFGGYLIGMAGVAGAWYSLFHEWEAPSIYRKKDIHSILIPGLKAFLEDVEETVMLIGHKGVLYEVHTDGWSAVQCPYMAIGSGGDYALGALHATRDFEPGERLRRALHASITHSITTGGQVDLFIA